MASSKKTTQRYQPTDSPEKIKDGGGFSDLLKTVSPVGFLDQIFGKSVAAQSKNTENQAKKDWENILVPQERKDKAGLKKGEVLVYAYGQRKPESSREQESMSREIQEIMKSLKEQVKILEKKQKTLAKDLSKVTVESLPDRPGIYYLRFFEWLLILIRQVRAKVEEGQTWLNAMTEKKKKVGFWNMSKKHGTSFSLSNERAMATQAG